MLGHMGVGPRAVAEAVTQEGIGVHAGPRRRLENKVMALPRLEPKTSYDECAYSFR